MSDTARPKTAGDKLSADEVNNDLPIPMTAGETINGATLPVAIYVYDADDEVYACDGNDADKLDFIGFAITNSTDGNGITIQTKGIVSGFTGLDTGKKYYVQDDQTIGTTMGTYELLVGVAISATQILIMQGSFEYCGTATDTAGTPWKPSITAPACARMAIIGMRTHDSSNDSNVQMQVTLMKKGLLSQKVSMLYNPNDCVNFTITWATNTISISQIDTAGIVSSIEIIGDFYK